MKIINALKEKWRTEKIATATFLFLGLAVILASSTTMFADMTGATIPDKSIIIVLLMFMGIAGVAMFRKDI